MQNIETLEAKVIMVITTLDEKMEILNDNSILVNALTASIFETQIGKSPYVGQIDGEPDHGQKEIDFFAPRLSMVRRLHGGQPSKTILGHDFT